MDLKVDNKKAVQSGSRTSEVGIKEIKGRGGGR